MNMTIVLRVVPASGPDHLRRGRWFPWALNCLSAIWGFEASPNLDLVSRRRPLIDSVLGRAKLGDWVCGTASKAMPSVAGIGKHIRCPRIGNSALCADGDDGCIGAFTCRTISATHMVVSDFSQIGVGQVSEGSRTTDKGQLRPKDNPYLRARIRFVKAVLRLCSKNNGIHLDITHQNG